MAVFVDTFTEPTSDTELTAHTPDTGTGYSRIHSDGAAPRISAIAATDRLKVSTGGNDSGVIYTCNGTYPSANYEAEITYVAGSGFATRPFYIFFRLADVDNWYALRMTAVAGGHQLYKKVAGTPSALGSAITIATGSVLKVSANGTTLKVFDDGVEVISVTDSGLSAAGKLGFGVGGGSELVTSTDDANGSWEFDSLTVTDLGGGDTTLVVADSGHGHESETPALTQAHLLAAADSDHGHAAENVALLQAHLLAAQDASHAHTAEAPALTQAHLLAVADAAHDHTAETVALTQAHLVAVEDAAHAHAVDNLDLSGAAELVVQDAAHGHAAESVALVQAYVLVVADATHSHTAETPALLQAYTLTVAEAAHAHAAANVDLVFDALLVVADANHAHAAESSALLQAHVLAVADSTHSHTAETPNLAQAYTLTVVGAAHAHAVDHLTLGGGGPYQIAPAARRVRVGATNRLTEPVGAGERVVIVKREHR